MIKISRFLLLFTLVFFSCCEKESSPDSAVEKYVEQLKEGTYNSMYLPDFGPQHIPGLLKYRHSEEMIQKFPVNPLSSMYLPECSLGIYVLWTIESIRLKASGSEGVFAGYPSLNPVIRFKNPENYDRLAPDNSQQVVAEAYNSWWNGPLSFDQKKKIDPLESTPYTWR